MYIIISLSCLQSLFMLGALLIAMSMQLDRKGLWNLLGPVLCAVLCMVTAWVRHTVKSAHLMGICWFEDC